MPTHVYTQILYPWSVPVSIFFQGPVCFDHLFICCYAYVWVRYVSVYVCLSLYQYLSENVEGRTHELMLFGTCNH